MAAAGLAEEDLEEEAAAAAPLSANAARLVACGCVMSCFIMCCYVFCFVLICFVVVVFRFVFVSLEGAHAHACARICALKKALCEPRGVLGCLRAHARCVCTAYAGVGREQARM